LDLAIDDQRIDHDPHIVHHHILRDGDGARIGIDFRPSPNVTAIGKGRRRFKAGRIIESLLKTGEMLALQP